MGGTIIAEEVKLMAAMSESLSALVRARAWGDRDACLSRLLLALLATGSLTRAGGGAADGLFLLVVVPFLRVLAGLGLCRAPP